MLEGISTVKHLGIGIHEVKSPIDTLRRLLRESRLNFGEGDLSVHIGRNVC